MVFFYFLTTGKFKYELNKKLLFLKSAQRHSRLLQLATRNEAQFLFHVSSNTLVKDIKSLALGEFVHCMFTSHCYNQVFFHACVSALFRLIITTKNVVQKLLCFFAKSTVLDSILYYFVQQVLWTLCSFGVRSFNLCRNVTTLTLSRQHHNGILKTYRFSHVYSSWISRLSCLIVLFS